MSHVGALSLMVIIRRWRLPTICITVGTLSIQSETLACWCYKYMSWTVWRHTDGNQRSMQAWLFSEHLLCCSYIDHMNTKNYSTFEWAWYQYLREDIHLHLKLTPGKDEWVKCPCARWCRIGNQEIMERALGPRGDQGIAVGSLISALIRWVHCASGNECISNANKKSIMQKTKTTLIPEEEKRILFLKMN